MSYPLDDQGNPCSDAKDEAAKKKQQVLAEIEKLLEIIRRLDEGEVGHGSTTALGGDAIRCPARGTR